MTDIGSEKIKETSESVDENKARRGSIVDDGKIIELKGGDENETQKMEHEKLLEEMRKGKPKTQ